MREEEFVSLKIKHHSEITQKSIEGMRNSGGAHLGLKDVQDFRKMLISFHHQGAPVPFIETKDNPGNLHGVIVGDCYLERVRKTLAEQVAEALKFLGIPCKIQRFPEDKKRKKGGYRRH